MILTQEGGCIIPRVHGLVEWVRDLLLGETQNRIPVVSLLIKSGGFSNDLIVCGNDGDVVYS